MKGSQTVSNACMAKYEDDEPIFALVGLSLYATLINELWILDALVTYVPTRSAFLALKSYIMELFLMGNNNACKIIGISPIQLKTNEKSIKTLEDFWYVPNLKSQSFNSL